MSYQSYTTSTKSKSKTRAGKTVPQINMNNASKFPETISVQIEQKKREDNLKIEEEIRNIQEELRAVRNRR